MHFSRRKVIGAALSATGLAVADRVALGSYAHVSLASLSLDGRRRAKTPRV